jgi:Rrf2 family iron-sulfur cluster assembly transcriptional regulator
MCGGNEDCQNGTRCLTHTLWEKLGNSILEFMDGITLASFLGRDKVSAVVRRQQSNVAIVVAEPILNNTAARQGPGY